MDEEESYYSQGEIDTRIKLLKQKSPSAPYLLLSYRERPPLYDSERDDDSEKAYSTNMIDLLKN